MNKITGVAKALTQSDYPLSITLNNVTVKLESYSVNKIFDCCNCYYMDGDVICQYRKDAALSPNPRKYLRAVEIVVHIINASNEEISAGYSNWTMQDSQGYAFTGIYPNCDRFYSRRLQKPGNVLGSTQSRQMIIFPELEDDIEPAQFILKTGLSEFKFEVAELSENIKHLLKPPAQADSITDKTKAYITSDSYVRFISAAQETNIDPEALDYIVTNLASNYYRFVGNSKNVWENEKQLLEYYPYIVSLAEIASFDRACKKIITIPNNAFNSCKAILDKYNISYKTYPIHIFGQEITAITFFYVYPPDYVCSPPKSWRPVKFTNFELACNEIASSRIKYGMCSLTKGFSIGERPEHIHLSGGRELDLFNIGRSACAGYREDLQESFRSSWEANVARVLRLTNHQYKYESQAYEMKKYNYLPDFILEDGTVLEVKGLWDAESLGKVSEFHKTYPEAKIIALDSDMYYDLDKKYSHISNWEHSQISHQKNVLPIVGMHFVADQTVFENLNIDDDVFLVREANNEFDNYAILATAVDGRPLGHISAEWASVYAPKMDAGMQYKAVIKEKAEKVIKIEVTRVNVEQTVLYDCLLSECKTQTV